MNRADLFQDLPEGQRRGESASEDGTDAGAGAADAPLADRLRPRELEEFVGQQHLVGPGRPLRRLIEEGRIPSLIFWGPPGTGKTTLARLLAVNSGAAFETFSAVLSGVKDIREVTERAGERRRASGRSTVLFVDEIHRFNKAQQDAFLPHVEQGRIVLVGSTTENPSFEVNSALLSRCTVFTLQPLSDEDLRAILHRALTDPERGLPADRPGEPVEVSEEAEDLLVGLADGDARVLLNMLEMSAEAAEERITVELVRGLLQKKTLRHDRAGESHYNLISALHKAVRGSDVDGALYWLARILEGGEDPLFVVRRIVRMAAEDVGLADPRALRIALAAKDTYHFLGSPEGEIALFEAVAYLALTSKSNAIYTAEKAARKAAAEETSYPVPLTIRNAPTGLMKDMGYGEGYLYDHDWPDALAPQTYLPPELEDLTLYRPTRHGLEAKLADRLEWLKEERTRRLAEREQQQDGQQEAGQGQGQVQEQGPGQGQGAGPDQGQEEER